MHFYHSGFVDSHAVAGGFIEFLAAHPGRWSWWLRFCKFDLGQVSDMFFLVEISLAHFAGHKLLPMPIFSRICSKHDGLFMNGFAWTDGHLIQLATFHPMTPTISHVSGMCLLRYLDWSGHL